MPSALDSRCSPFSGEIELGCGEDWDPAREATALAPTDAAGIWESTSRCPPGSSRAGAAIGGGWDEAYGLDGGRPGSRWPSRPPR